MCYNNIVLIGKKWSSEWDMILKREIFGDYEKCRWYFKTDFKATGL